MHALLVRVITIVIITPLHTQCFFDELVKRNSVKVVNSWNKECTSDCSIFSTGINGLVQCSMQECYAPESSETAQAPEVDNERHIYFETVVDDNYEQRLALHFSWSPVDNISMRKTTGYRIEISNGESNYSVCYNISTPMLYPNNTKDIYYNDCFGRIAGTHITPGSEITVRVASLPLWDHDNENGVTTRIIEVPDCTNRALLTLAECEGPGGRPTRRPCLSDSCNTRSHVNNETHHINCTISQFSIQRLFKNFKIEECDNVTRAETGFPSPPVHVQQDQEWYKFVDEETGEIKIALNFSWTPGQDSAVESLHHYSLQIVPKTLASTVFTNKCFAVHTKLDYEKHRKAVFYYDCIGRGNGKILEPGEKFTVYVTSRPYRALGKIPVTEFEIRVPDCTDEKMYGVTACEGSVSGKIEEVYCANRSVKYTYNVHDRGEGSRAEILSCRTLPGGRVDCDRDISARMDNLKLSGTLYNISFASDMDINTNITIHVVDSEDRGMRYPSRFSFSHCSVTVRRNVALVAVVAVIGVICFIIMLFLIFYFSRRCRITKAVMALCHKKPESKVTVDVNNALTAVSPSSNQSTQDEAPVMPANMRVYVVFKDDHELHRNVMHWFCAYLKQDLGLDVRVHIWQPAEVALNQITYMKRNMQLAEKVIIICSEGSKNCLEKKEYDGDLFTPVIQEVSQNVYLGKNPEKYLVGYFPYSEPDHVPELLHDQCLIYFSLFKLMKQFEQFYFRLVGIEQFQQGAIYRIDKIAFDRYYDPALTTCGKKLKESIDEMKKMVKAHPTWYTDHKGSDLSMANIPAAPLLRVKPPQSTEETSILQDIPGQASIRYIAAKPPCDLSGGCPRNISAQRGTAAYRVQASNPVKSNLPQKEDRHCYEDSKLSMSSFVLSESDQGSLGSHQAEASRSIPETESFDRNNRRPYSATYSESNQPLFWAESFDDRDFVTHECESLDCSRLGSNKTEITILGLSPSQEELAKFSDRSDDVFKDVSPTTPGSPPVPGVFSLATLEDSVEDFEDEFKSINLSKCEPDAVV